MIPYLDTTGTITTKELEDFLAEVQSVFDGPPLIKFEPLNQNDWFKNRKEN